MNSGGGGGGEDLGKFWEGGRDLGEFWEGRNLSEVWEVVK